jgi:anti-sigma factor RsiW
MKPCDHDAVQILLYVDNELRGDELAAFEAHLRDCAACRETVAQERRFLDELHSAQPLYPTPAELRAHVEKILLDQPVYTAPPDLRARVRKILDRPRFLWSRWHTFQAIAVVALFAIVFGLAFLRRSAHSELADLAIKAHKRYVGGELALEVRSASPQIVSDWVNGRMPLHLKLPAYDEMPELVHPVQLKGGGLLRFRKSGAAYVVYHVRHRPVSLIAVSSSISKPSGGKRVDMKPLSFYYDSVDGYNVITWLSKSGLVTYAMISDGGELPQQSCIVCHASSSASDRNLMSRLLSQ